MISIKTSKNFSIDTLEIISALFAYPNWQMMFCKYKAFQKLRWNIAQFQINVTVILFNTCVVPNVITLSSILLIFYFRE